MLLSSIYRPAYNTPIMPWSAVGALSTNGMTTGGVRWLCKERSRQVVTPTSTWHRGSISKSDTRCWTNSHSSMGQEKCWVVVEATKENAVSIGSNRADR
jgi:hypothetical protein